MTPTNATAPVACDIRDISLAPQGKRRIEWAYQSMPVLQAIRKQFIKEQPFAGVRIAACFDLTSQTANLAVTLRDGGADLAVCAARTADDEVAASLVRDYHLPVYALANEDPDLQRSHILSTLATNPMLALDTDARVASQLPASVLSLVETLRPSTYANQPVPVVLSSRGGVHRLIAGQYGVGQRTVEVLLSINRVLFAGLHVAIAGYSQTGSGIASCLRGLGADVTIIDFDPARALRAVLDGYRVTGTNEAVRVADLILTAAYSKNVLSRDHFEHMKDGATVANAGHSTVEIDLDGLQRLAASHRQVRDNIDEFKTRDGRRLYLLAGGKPLDTIGEAEQPAQVVDIMLANQALCLEYLAKEHTKLEARIYPVPESVDRRLSRTKLDTMGVTIEKPTIEQEEYLASWSEGF